MQDSEALFCWLTLCGKSFSNCLWNGDWSDGTCMYAGVVSECPGVGNKCSGIGNECPGGSN